MPDRGLGGFLPGSKPNLTLGGYFMDSLTRDQNNVKPSFDKQNIVGIAYCLTLCGFTPVPLNDELKPIVKWRAEDYHPLKVSKKVWERAKGITIKCGKVSNLIVIDVDDPEKFNRFYPIENLKQEANYVIQTKDPGHYHFGFLYEEDFSKNVSFLEKAGFEIKSDGGLANFYSTIPTRKYTLEKLDVLKPLPEKLKQKIKKLLDNKKGKPTLHAIKSFEKHTETPEFLAKKILETLEPYYTERFRHDFVLGVAGVFRKAGIPRDVAEDILIDFCRRKGDDEIRDRATAVKTTYEKRDVLSVSGVDHLEKVVGVNKEDIERINKLTRKQRWENTQEQKQEKTEERVPVAKRALSLLEEQKLSFWFSQFDEPYVTISPTQHLKLESKDFKDYLQSLLYETDGRTLHNQALEEVISICRQWARRSNLRHHVHLRTGFDAERNFIEVNLGRPDGKVLHITENGYAMTDPELKFLRPKNLLPIPFDPDMKVNKDTYTKESVLELFSKIFHLQAEEDFALMLAWMLKTFYPVGEYPILAILGEKEAVGKTTISKFIANLLDPTPSPLKTFPRNRDDLYSLAKNNFLLVFDNLSGISPDMSDALCQLSTGGSLSKRKLYTDGDSVDYPLKNPIVLNSIFNILHRRDLRRRCVVIELKKPSEIKSQKELDQIFREYAPHCYAYLVRCVQEALKNKVIDAPLLDLADFCEWIAKAHPVFFLDGRSFVETLNTNREQTSVEILETNLVASYIKSQVDWRGEWITTANDLLKEIRATYPNEKDIPLTPERMSREIKKIASDLEAVGVKTEFRRTKYSRELVFRKMKNTHQQENNEDEIEYLTEEELEELKDLLR
jgi:hypothetical protein